MPHGCCVISSMRGSDVHCGLRIKGTGKATLPHCSRVSVYWFHNSSWTSFGKGEDFYEGKCYKSAVAKGHQTPCGMFMISPVHTSFKTEVLAIKLPTRKITYESNAELLTVKHPFENPSSSCSFSTPKLWRDREGEKIGCTLQSPVINNPGLKQSQSLCPVSEQKQLSLSKNVSLMMREPKKNQPFLKEREYVSFIMFVLPCPELKIRRNRCNMPGRSQRWKSSRVSVSYAAINYLP